MAFDGITLKSVLNELNSLIDGKVDSIYEPTETSIVIKVYNKKLYCLNIDTSATNYRLHLTTHLKKNPEEAPNFCMVLRKYLLSSRITKIYMDGLERICYIDFECFADNERHTRTLVIELMGKYSNVILLDDKNIVIDALKKFNNEEKERNIAPNKRYYLPDSDKKDFTNIEYKEFKEIVFNSQYKTLDLAIPNLFTGTSKIFIQAALDTLHISNTISESNLKNIFDYMISVITDDQKSKCINFKNGYSIIEDENDADSFAVNFFLDDFYFEKTEEETYISYRNSLLKILSNTLDKLSNKMNNINEKIKDCENMEQYKTYGELLIANIYKFTDGHANDETITLENYYNNNENVEIKIDPSISISKNADKYFKKYNKMKNTLAVVKIQKEQTEKELNYLGSLIQSLDNCKTIEDVDTVYNEISQNILFNDLKSKKQHKSNKKNELSMLNNYIKTKIDGFDVLVGKNNKQNDYITLKVANDNDMWFHAKEIHGSHLILRCNGEIPKISTITKCAQICAYYSKAKYSSHVPVDYCQVKYVKKPHGANPGYVIYTNNKTVYVDPQTQV